MREALLAIVAGEANSLWIYLTAPFLGGCLAALAHRRLGPAATGQAA